MLLHHKTIKIKGRVVVCSIPWLCIVKMAKNGFFHEAGKKGRSNANPNKLFYSNDLNTMSFKFRDIFIIFEFFSPDCVLTAALFFEKCKVKHFSSEKKLVI